MFSPPSMNREDYQAFMRALKAPLRTIRLKAHLFDRNEKPLGLPISLAEDGGEVNVDATNVLEEPTYTAHINLADPDNRLPVDGPHVIDGRVWWAKFIGVWWGIWVQELSRWEDIPVFRGGILTVERDGPLVLIDAQSKDGQHLGSYSFRHTFTVREHTRVWRAIQEIFRDRGETHFDLNRTAPRIHKDRNWPIGASPWRAGQYLANELNEYQLYYRPNGVLRLRKIPEKPCWAFTEGQDAIVTDASNSYSIADLVQVLILKSKKITHPKVYTQTSLAAKASPGDNSISVNSNKHFSSGRQVVIGRGDKRESRSVASISGTTINLKGPLQKRHEKGAFVNLHARVKTEVRLEDGAQLPAWHPLSDAALSSNNRPRIRIEELDRVKNEKELAKKAAKRLDHIKAGINQEVAFSCPIVPHLEPLDLVKLSADGVSKLVRMKRWTYQLRVDGMMEVNHKSKRVPDVERSDKARDAGTQKKKAWSIGQSGLPDLPSIPG